MTGRTAITAVVAAGLLLVACSATDDIAGSSGPAPELLERYASGDLSCPQPVFESGEYEAGMAEPGAGHPTIEAAVDAYWSTGDGSFRDDRATLRETVEPPTVRYSDVDGHPLLILSFVQRSDGWLLDQSNGCWLGDDLGEGS